MNQLIHLEIMLIPTGLEGEVGARNNWLYSDLLLKEPVLFR